jgi:hypothetical protein
MYISWRELLQALKLQAGYFQILDLGAAIYLVTFEPEVRTCMRCKSRYPVASKLHFAYYCGLYFAPFRLSNSDIGN